MMLNSRARRSLRRRLVQSLTELLAPEMAEPGPLLGVPRRVAIVRSNHRLGNVLMLTPLVQEVQALWPGAYVDIIAGGRLREIFQEFSAIKRCVEMPRPPARALLSRSFRQQLAQSYDLVINADSQSQSGRLISGILSTRHRLDASRPIESRTTVTKSHMALRPVDLLHRMACAGPGHEQWPMTLKLTQTEQSRGARELAEIVQGEGSEGAVVGLYPFGDKGRDFPLSWWQQCLAQLRQQVPGVCLVEILPAHGQILLDTVPSKLAGQDLRALCAQLGAMDLVLATDSGMMHLAACSGATTFGLFRATDPAVYAPYGGNNRGWTWSEATPDRLAGAVRSALTSRARGCGTTSCPQTGSVDRA